MEKCGASKDDKFTDILNRSPSVVAEYYLQTSQVPVIGA